MRVLYREALEEFSSNSFLPCIPPEDANLEGSNISTASHFQGPLPSTHHLQILDYHSDKLQVLTSSETESLGLGSILGGTHRRQGGRALWGLAAVLDLGEGPRPAGTFFPKCIVHVGYQQWQQIVVFLLHRCNACSNGRPRCFWKLKRRSIMSLPSKRGSLARSSLTKARGYLVLAQSV